MSNVDALNCWSQFPVGAVVKIKSMAGGSAAGRHGVVVERLDDNVDGYARYCVAVDAVEASAALRMEEFRRKGGAS